MSKNNLYLICGEENFFITQAVRELKQKYVDPALEAFALDIIPERERDISRIINSVQTIPSFTPNRLVLIYDPFFLKASKKTDTAENTDEESTGLDTAGEELLRTALENIPDGVLVAFIVHGSIDQRKKFFKFFQKYGEVRKFEVFAQWDKLKVIDWLKTYLQNKKITIDPAAADFLVEVSGVSLDALVNEIEKILTYAAGKNRLTLSDVQAVASQGELNIFSLDEALRQRAVPEVLRLTTALLKDGEAPQMLLGRAAAQLRLLLQIKELQAQKKSFQDIAGVLKRNPYYIKRIMESDLPKYTLAQLKNAYYELQNADFQMKTGQLNPENALICALASLA